MDCVTSNQSVQGMKQNILYLLSGKVLITPLEHLKEQDLSWAPGMVSENTEVVHREVTALRAG